MYSGCAFIGPRQDAALPRAAPEEVIQYRLGVKGGTA